MSNTVKELSEFETLEEYFLSHPDEENDFYDDMAMLAYHEDIIELPEDWIA